jgi:hypothetical protein
VPQRPTGPPPARTPEHEAQVARDLEAASVQRQAAPVWSEEQQALEARRHAAWLARGERAKPSPFSVGRFPSGIDLLGEARIGTAGTYGVGVRAGGYLTLFDWLSAEARLTLMSEAYRSGHHVTGGAYLGARASYFERDALMFIALGLGLERMFTGPAEATPGITFAPALGLGLRKCVVPFPSGSGCLGIGIDMNAALRIPNRGDDDLGKVRVAFGFGLGPAVVF